MSDVQLPPEGEIVLAWWAADDAFLLARAALENRP